VRRGVKLNTSIPVPGGPEDLLGTLAVGANARLSAYVGGLNIHQRLDPAAPEELADEAREFANLLTDIGASAIAGASDSDPDQVARLKAADAATKLGELCTKLESGAAGERPLCRRSVVCRNKYAYAPPPRMN
jgi:hypothetical protein